MSAYRSQAPEAAPTPGWRFRPRHLAWLLGLAFAMLAARSFWGWLAKPETLPVRELQVEGNLQHVRAEWVRLQVQPLAAKGFLGVDPDAVRATLRQMPWVADASVWRVWPDRLRIRIVEQQAVARWQNGQQVQLVNALGQPFSVPVNQVPRGLPLLQGPAGQQALVLQRFLEADRITRAAGARLVALNLDARGAWRCRLDPGVDIALGRNGPLERLQRWMAVYPQVRAYLGAKATVDLRYANGFAMMNLNTGRETE